MQVDQSFVERVALAPLHHKVFFGLTRGIQGDNQGNSGDHVLVCRCVGVSCVVVVVSVAPT